VADGRAALAALRAAPADLLLSDVMMPQLDGFGLLRAIRADPALADLPVILLSARAGEEASAEGLETGANDYLVKPFSARDLAARVATNLELARLRRQGAAALREMNEALERRVAERTQALEAESVERRRVEAMLEQAQRLEAIGQLTGGVAHDFNNLLTVIIVQAESIMHAAAGNDRIVDMAKTTQRVAERGAQLTAQLLAFARRQLLRPQPVFLHRVMAAAGELVRRAAGEAITVEIDDGPGLWPCLVDATQFEAAIVNLAVNARDAMPEGGSLTVRLSNADVHDTEAQRLNLASGDYVVVSVTDTGPGMPADVQRHCFEPFFTTKDIGKGTGLGLSQVYGFARQSGGVATVESATGRGTTISLYLPRTDAAAEPAPKAAPETAAPIAGHHKTVLVVEDQSEVRDIVEFSLTELGYCVLAAPDGIEARRILESDEVIDLLLTDVVMPNRISGLELAQWARRVRQDIKIVLVSGYSRDISDADCGDFVFLEKPFRAAQLAKTIASALQG
jgi:signal transduction histidine kinase